MLAAGHNQWALADVPVANASAERATAAARTSAASRTSCTLGARPLRRQISPMQAGFKQARAQEWMESARCGRVDPVSIAERCGFPQLALLPLVHSEQGHQVMVAFGRRSAGIPHRQIGCPRRGCVLSPSAGARRAHLLSENRRSGLLPRVHQCGASKKRKESGGYGLRTKAVARHLHCATLLCKAAFKMGKLGTICIDNTPQVEEFVAQSCSTAFGSCPIRTLYAWASLAVSCRVHQTRQQRRGGDPRRGSSHTSIIQ